MNYIKILRKRMLQRKREVLEICFGVTPINIVYKGNL